SGTYTVVAASADGKFSSSIQVVVTLAPAKKDAPPAGKDKDKKDEKPGGKVPSVSKDAPVKSPTDVPVAGAPKLSKFTGETTDGKTKGAVSGLNCNLKLAVPSDVTLHWEAANADQVEVTDPFGKVV